MTGWANPPLNDAGRREVVERAPRLLLRSDTVVVTSPRTRTRETAHLLMRTVGLSGSPRECWRLSERHLGQLEGLTRSAAEAIWGRGDVREWRRGDVTAPPALDESDPRHPRHDHDYAPHLGPSFLATESRREAQHRVLAGWSRCVEPLLLAGTPVVVVGHCHSLRLLVEYLHPDDTANDVFSEPSHAVRGRWENSSWNFRSLES